MRSFDVFASMSPERATEVIRTLKEAAPGMFAQALAAAAAAFKARPVYLARQPLEKQAASIRSALARVAANPVAEELLAVYFLECKKDLLVEWLDSLGIEHEDGTLDPLQEAFMAEGASQCGYCTPAMVLTAKSLLDAKPNPNEEEIRQALAGVLCRCTGYRKIVQAVKTAAQSRL